jgi:hypothetical protein
VDDYIIDADRSTLSFDPEALDRLSDQTHLKKFQPQAKRWAMFELTYNFNPKAKNQC